MGNSDHGTSCTYKASIMRFRYDGHIQAGSNARTALLIANRGMYLDHRKCSTIQFSSSMYHKERKKLIPIP